MRANNSIINIVFVIKWGRTIAKTISDRNTHTPTTFSQKIILNTRIERYLRPNARRIGRFGLFDMNMVEISIAQSKLHSGIIKTLVISRDIVSFRVYLTIHAQIIIGDTITMSSRLEKRSFGNQIAVIP